MQDFTINIRSLSYVFLFYFYFSICNAWNVVSSQQRKSCYSYHISLCIHGVSTETKVLEATMFFFTIFFGL